MSTESAMEGIRYRSENLLADFEPTFEFKPVGPLPECEFVERLRRIRREAVVGEYDALIVHTDGVGWFHTSNSYLRYVCDWAREGLLIIPTDENLGLQLLSFYTPSVVLPPPGEPLLVEKIWQVGPWGREYLDRPGSAVKKVVQAAASIFEALGLSEAKIGMIGDRTSIPYFTGLQKAMPTSVFVDEKGIIERMQRVRSPLERDIFRAAAQLADIGIQAAYHVTRPGVTDHEIYAAYTFAQMARGGETGDGYQIGINRFGTHCGKPYGHIVKPGDLINLYISNTTYQGYSAQIARMIAVGEITAEQEDVIAMCVDGVQRAQALIRPGTLVRDVNNAAFEPYIERGFLGSPEAREMPFNWQALENGEPREIPHQYVEAPDWERQGRTLMHVYPATKGPHNPNLGHAVSMYGMNNYNISSHNYDRLEEGMVFVLHTQWLDPLNAGCNVGDFFLVNENGYENLSCHTPLDVHRIKV
ncbi:MAG: Xaa-Pro peptidase family protein [Novosphingobium sp.]